MIRLETPEETARRAMRELRDSLRRANRRYLRFAEDIDGLRMTCGAKRPEQPVDISRDLPPELLLARRSTHLIYRALRSLLVDATTETKIWPADIQRFLLELDPKSDPSINTINHALQDLRERELAWSHVERGWR